MRDRLRPKQRFRGRFNGWRYVQLAAAAWLVAMGASAQTPIDRVTDSVDVVEVLLDVLVTDTDGHVIVGLEQDDFIVREGDREVELESVSFYSNRDLWSGFGEVEAQASDTSVNPDRFFVLFFYRPPMVELREVSYYAKLSKAGKQALDWVAHGVMPDDYVAVVTYDGALNVVQNFTRDPELITQSVWRSATGKAPKKQWKSRTSDPIEGISLAPLMHDPEVRRRTDDLYSAISELAMTLGGVRGRKVLTLFGADFPSASSLESRSRYAPMVEALNANNVAAYPIDVTAEGQKPTLIRLARDTGGRYPARAQRADEALAEVARENSGYYLLSYRAEHSAGDAGYQEVTVETKNPELSARSRSGYRYGAPTVE